MLIAIVHVPAPPAAEVAAALEQRFADRLPLVAQAPGFLGFELLRPVAGASTYLSISRWRTRADFDAWVGSTYNAQAHGRPGVSAPADANTNAGGVPPGVELYELSEP